MAEKDATYKALLYLAGWSGAHRFYMGDIFWGICYLLTLGFLGFGVLIDALLLSEESNDKRR